MSGYNSTYIIIAISFLAWIGFAIYTGLTGGILK